MKMVRLLIDITRGDGGEELVPIQPVQRTAPNRSLSARLHCQLK
jgi:hypothetical protein